VRAAPILNGAANHGGVMFGQAGPVQSQVQNLVATAGAQQAQGRPAGALATLQQALTTARAGGPALVGQVMVAIATLRAGMGDSGEAASALQQAAQLFGEAGDRPSEIRAQIELAGLLASSGQADNAMGLLQRCLAAASQVGGNQLMAEVHGAVGQLLLGLGRPQAAAQEFGAALDLATGLPDPLVAIQLRVFLAVAVFKSGDVSGANSLLAENARRARGIPDLTMSAMGLGAVSDALRVIQRPLDALTVGQEVVAKLRQAGAQPQLVQATLALADICAQVGRPAEFAQHKSEALAGANQLGGPAAVASALMQLGMMAMQRGDQVAAGDLLGQARAQAAAAGVPQPPALTQMLGQLGL
jgi:tetratricopeptide (TPR) repeat protein